MSLLSSLRLLVFARRCALALERIALSVERLVDYREREWMETHRVPVSARKGKSPVEFGSFDVVEAERRWKQRRAEQMLDVDEEA